jgi:hypothetical protein
MFATHDGLQAGMQFSDDSTIWRGVEVMLNVPWVLATLKDAERNQSHYLLQDPEDLVQLLSQSPGINMTGLQLVQPPTFSPTGNWAFVPICRVEQEVIEPHGPIPEIVLFCAAGDRYAGFPIKKISPAPREFVTLYEVRS